MTKILNQKSSELTVIIPTLGRDTIFNSLKSIDIPCKVIVVFDPIVSDELRLKIIDSVDDSMDFEYTTSDISGAGPVKNFGIKLVSSDYFIILDDDDEFIPGFLKLALEAIKYNEGSWLSTHWKDGENKIYAYDFIIINDLFYFEKYYFNWSTYPKDFNESIYPNSSILIKTKDYIDYLNNEGYEFKSIVNDDVLPMTDFMMSNKGLNHRGYGFIVNSTSNSVSRGKVDYTNDHKELLFELAKRASDGSSIRSKIWNRVISNLLFIWNHANK